MRPCRSLPVIRSIAGGRNEPQHIGATNRIRWSTEASRPDEGGFVPDAQDHRAPPAAWCATPTGTPKRAMSPDGTTLLYPRLVGALPPTPTAGSRCGDSGGRRRETATHLRTRAHPALLLLAGRPLAVPPAESPEHLPHARGRRGTLPRPQPNDVVCGSQTGRRTARSDRRGSDVTCSVSSPPVHALLRRANSGVILMSEVDLPGDCDFLSGGGEMGPRMRAFDWATTPLGSPEGRGATPRSGGPLLSGDD
jgi:hypothetical protein